MVFDVRLFAAAIACLGIAAGAPTAALADCYDHNGSLMRLDWRGAELTIRYERPRDALRAAGVARGTVLVNGRVRAHAFRGTARRFSRHCPGRPLTYPVSSWIEGEGPLVLEGRYEVHERCRPTGRFRADRLVFTRARC